MIVRALPVCLVLLAGCGGGHAAAPHATRAPVARTAPAPAAGKHAVHRRGARPAHAHRAGKPTARERRIPVRARARAARSAVRAVHTCVDAHAAARPRHTKATRHLSPQLQATQWALAVAAAAKRELRKRFPHGPQSLADAQAVAAANARLAAVLRLNYALERGDPQALAINASVTAGAAHALANSARRAGLCDH